MPARWTIDIVDINGNSVTEAGIETVAKSKQFTFQLGAPDIFTCMLPLTSYEASVVASNSETSVASLGKCYVKAYRQGANESAKTLRFYGPAWIDEVQGGGGGNGVDMLALTAFDPSIMLTKRYTVVADTDDLGTLLKEMVDTTNTNDGETGIRTNSANVSASSTGTIDYSTQRTLISQVRDSFFNQLDGCEAWINPIELASGKIGDLYVALSRGQDSTWCEFGYGESTAANCRSMSRVRNMSEVENDINASSENLTAAQKTDATSVAAYRRHMSYPTYTGEKIQSQIDARAQGRLDWRKTPERVAVYQAEPAGQADNLPVLFDDYDIGDTVTLNFNKGVAFTVPQRVYSATLDVNDQGVEIPGGWRFRAL